MAMTTTGKPAGLPLRMTEKKGAFHLKQRKQAVKDLTKRIVIGLLLFMMAISMLAPIYAAEIDGGNTSTDTQSIIVSSGEISTEIVDVESEEVTKEESSGGIISGNDAEHGGLDDQNDGLADTQDSGPVTEVSEEELQEIQDTQEQAETDHSTMVTIAIVGAIIAAVILLAVILLIAFKLRSGRNNSNEE